MEKMYSEENKVLGCQDNTAALAEGQKTYAEEFLEQHYLFRRNVLRDIVEYAVINGDEEPQWLPLTDKALNSICLQSKRELGEDVDLKGDIRMYVDSDEPQAFDPVEEWLEGLPEWDGTDRVVDFWKRIPGVTAEQLYYLSIWMRSLVAHWLKMDVEHGNECVPVLIGDQGSGKTTFCRRILPPQLRMYFLDHFNLGNKFDKDMAMSNSLIINLDELDKYTAKQMAEIKMSLSKTDVVARKIYGKTIDMKHRYASFVATTNCLLPLTDPTGSRRFICIESTKGVKFDNITDIDYDQLYAQIVYELKVERKRYWFNDDETSGIQQLNSPYMSELNLEDMIKYIWRKPHDGEETEEITTEDIQKSLLATFPTISMPQVSTIKIGKALKGLDIEKRRSKHGRYYQLVSRKTA